MRGIAVPVLLLSCLALAQTAPQQTAPAGKFRVAFDKSGITSLKRAGDKYDTDYIADEATLGHVRVRYKMGETEWRQFSTDDPKNKFEKLRDERSPRTLQQLAIVYNPQQWIRNEYYADLEV